MSLNNSTTRKARSEDLLKAMGIPVNPSLPVIEAEEDVSLRPADEVAKRAIVLCAVAARGEGGDLQEVKSLLDEFDVWDAVTPKEKELLHDESPEKQAMVNAVWRYEGLWVLLWALGHVEDIGPPISFCDVPRSVDLILQVSAESFISQARLRPKSEILDEADLIYRYDWAVVDANVNGTAIPGDLNPGVVYERHYALNWLVGYMDQEWDDVTTDT